MRILALRGGLAFPTYCVVPRLAMAADVRRYRDLTTSDPAER